jgi:chromodomain-helicase-DNA-binding protein 7
MLATLAAGGSKTFNFNNIDIQLRKCCNHLFLLKGVEEELTKGCRTEQELYRKMLDGSGKMILLDKFIDIVIMIRIDGMQNMNSEDDDQF